MCYLSSLTFTFLPAAMSKMPQISQISHASQQFQTICHSISYVEVEKYKNVSIPFPYKTHDKFSRR